MAAVFHVDVAVIADGVCIAQLGGKDNGIIAAYDLATGAEKWKWTGEGPSYASPNHNGGGRDEAGDRTDGPEPAGAEHDGRQGGMAVAVRREGNGRVQYGDADCGRADFDLLRIRPRSDSSKAGKGRRQDCGEGTLEERRSFAAVQQPSAQGRAFVWSDAARQFCVRQRPERRDVVDRSDGEPGRLWFDCGCGPVLLALTPRSQLIVFEPNDKAYTEVASIKVANKQVYAYPVLAGNRLYVEDQDSLTLWSFE